MKIFIKIIIVGFIFISFIGCDKEDIENIFNKGDYTYKTVVMESPDGRLKVTFQYDTEDELEYLDLYWDSIIDFQDNIINDYEHHIDIRNSKCEEGKACR